MVDRPIEYGRGAEPVVSERRHDRVCLPMATRRVIAETRAAGTPAIASEQIGRHPAFIEEDVLARVADREPFSPVATLSHDVGAPLFFGVYRFF